MKINLLRNPQMDLKTGQCKSSRYNDIQEGTQVPPVKLSKRISVWPEHEVDAVLAARIEGQTEEDIKALVLHLVEQRKKITKHFTGLVLPSIEKDQPIEHTND